MELSLASLAELLRQSVQDTRGAVARLLALNPPMQVLWQAMGAVVAMSAVLAYLASALFPVPVETPWAALTASPLRLAGTQAAGILLVSAAMTVVGRVFGGHGRFQQALLLAIWIEFVLLCVQLVQVVLMLLFPLLASLLGLFAVVLFFWLVTRFTAHLHGFTRMWPVFLGVFATLFLGGLLAAMVLGVLGLVPVVGV
jgi:hypothetical protein